jgi:hypothetical protein
MATSIQSSQFSVSQTRLSVGAALAAAPKATTGGDARGSAAAACSQRVRREGGEQGMRARATADDADSIAIGEASHGLCGVWESESWCIEAVICTPSVRAVWIFEPDSTSRNLRPHQLHPLCRPHG